jgi:transposase
MVAVSNHINNPKTAIEIYRAKDVIEKCFYIYKNFIDGDRLRVHSSIAMNNKIFILFIALIILSRIHKVMVDNDLYKNFTMKELIKIMEGHEMFLVKNRKILKPATATQKRIYSAFGINPPNTGEVGRENNF